MERIEKLKVEIFDIIVAIESLMALKKQKFEELNRLTKENKDATFRDKKLDS